MNIEKLLNPSSNDVWSNYVPIISDKNHTTAYITNTIEEPSEYNELCFRLKSASPAEIFTLVINTPGGILDSALMLVDAIKTSKAKVIAQISGTVASAGTIITLACDDVEVAPHTAFMIHNYSSSGGHGKGHEIKAMQAFVDANLNASFTSLYGGFLTPKEIRDVIDGKDIWMGQEEVLSRWAGKLETNTTEPVDIPVVSTTISRRGRKPKTVK